MSDIMYSVSEWKGALATAEDNDFDPVDSDQDHGPLAAWLCEQYTHEKAEQNGEILEAVISVLEKEGYEAFSPETFLTVLISYQGETTDSFQMLVDEHLEDNYGFTGSLPGNPTREEYTEWYLENCRNDGEIYAEVASGIGLYWFDKNKW